VQAKYLLFFRAVLLEILLLQTAYAPGASLDSRLWAVFAFYAVFAAALYLLSRGRRLPPSAELGSFMVDIAATSGVLYLTEGFTSDLYTAYFLVILASCLLENLAYSFVVGAVACVVYGSLALPGLGQENDSFFLLRTSLLLATSFFSAYVANTARRVERETSERYEQRLAWMQRLSLVGEAIAKVLHEVKTPLNTITLSAEYAREMHGRGQEESFCEQLDLIAQEADRAARILSDYLEFVRPAELALKPLFLQAPLASTIEAMRGRMEERGIVLEASLDRELRVKGSQRHLTQVFMNLFVNAIEAMPFGGRLAVRLEASGALASVSISDTGGGLTPEAQARLFEPFAVPASGGKGHGLGLSIARWILQKHSGDIRLESKGPGKGATVRIRLPLIAEKLT